MLFGALVIAGNKTYTTSGATFNLVNLAYNWFGCTVSSIWCLCDRAPLIQKYKEPTRCNNNNFIDNFNHLNMFRAIISPILRRIKLCLQLVVWSTDDVASWWPGWGEASVPPHPGHQLTASSVLYTTSCKHSLLLLRMGEIIARNMVSWLKFLIKLLLLHLVGCLYYCLFHIHSVRHEKKL